MKIPVRNENQSVLSATAVKIKDLSSGLEKITVRALKKRVRIPIKIIEDEPTQAPEETTTNATSTKDSYLKRILKKLKSTWRTFPSLLAQLLGTVSNKRMKARHRVMLVGALLAVPAGLYFALATNNTVVQSENNPTSADTTPHYEAPQFQTVLPRGKNIEQLGGWVRISPPNRDPVYTFTDKVDSVEVTLSQQPLPDDFKNDTQTHVSRMANEFGASEQVPAGETTVHIGTSTKGPQSVIFADSGLLILIKSADTIENEQWAEYIKSLQ